MAFLLGLLQQICEQWISVQFSLVQSLSRVWLLATPWIAVRQASLSITNSWSLLKLMSIKSVVPSNHLILCHPLLLLPPILPSIRVQLDYNLPSKVLKVIFTTLSLPGLCMADAFSKVLIALSRNNIKRWWYLFSKIHLFRSPSVMSHERNKLHLM